MDDPLSKSLKSLTRFPSYKKQLCQETNESSYVPVPGTEPGTRGATNRSFLAPVRRDLKSFSVRSPKEE